MKSPNRGRTGSRAQAGLVGGRSGRPEVAEPEAEERTRVDRVVRDRLRLVPDLEPRGRGLRDPDRLDGPDLDGTPQGNCLSAVRLHVYGQRRSAKSNRAGRAASTGRRVESGTCENCRFESAVGDTPSFSGDRIYVMKDGLSLPFFGEAGRVKLKRWDVAVFKLPEEPEVRYIKRLVGMPNEVIRIDGGDLWVQPLDRSRGFRAAAATARPSAGHADDGLRRCPSRAGTRRTIRAGCAGRPHPAGAWTQPSRGPIHPIGTPPDWTELRYHHVVPSPAQWASDSRRPAVADSARRRA